MYLLVLSENYKTSLHSRTTVFPGFAGTFSFGARLTPLNLALLEKREKQRFNEFCHSPFPLFFVFKSHSPNIFLIPARKGCLIGSSFNVDTTKSSGFLKERP